MMIEGYRAVLVLLCIFCSSASAQPYTSTVFGNVRDESGAALQAVEIQIVEENTQSTRHATSGAMVRLSFPLFLLGGTW